MKKRGIFGKMFHFWEKMRMSKYFVSKIFYISRIISLIILMVILAPSVHSQNWEGMRKTGFWERWAINANVGYTSYFGDLSLHDNELISKITHESGPAYGAIVSKYLNNIIGISGQILVGNLKGSNGNLAFKSELIEYNLQLRVNFVNLINNRKNHRIGVLGYAGIGQFFFTTEVEKSIEENVTTYSTYSKVPEFVMFAGGGIHYILGSNYSISAGLSLRQSYNDKLDGVIKNGDNDYYTYLNIGLTYYIPTFIKGPLRNKARIACSNFKFSLAHR
jgi:hypothetical protein